MSGPLPSQVLLPMFGLVAWTFLVLLRVPCKRIGAVRAGRVTARDFALGESDAVPPDVRLPNRNLMNLLEMPVLMYTACLTAYVMRQVDVPVLLLAWTYVALRIAHSLVHLTYNKVLHRLVLFATSNLALGLLWLHLFAGLV